MCVRNYEGDFEALMACNQVLAADCRVVSVAWGQMSAGNSMFEPDKAWFVWFEYNADTDLDKLDDAIGRSIHGDKWDD